MSTNLEYRARERQRKRESGRQASEAQREKGQQGFRARDKKQRRHFLVGRTTRSFWKFHVVVMQNNGKEMYKKKCVCGKLPFC